MSADGRRNDCEHQARRHAWFEERQPVPAEAMQAGRAVILSVDERITEVIKWKTGRGVPRRTRASD